MSLAAQVTALSTRIANEIKAVRAEIAAQQTGAKVHVGTTPPPDDTWVWVDTTGLS